MAKPRVYVEDTTVISYLTAQPSRDLVLAAHRKSRASGGRVGIGSTCSSQRLCLKKSLGLMPWRQPVASPRPRAWPSFPVTEPARALARGFLEAAAIPLQGGHRRRTRGDRRHAGVDFLVTLELSTHRQCGGPREDRGRVSSRRISASGHLHPAGNYSRGGSMSRDPIIDEVRAIRDAIAKEHNYDLDSIFRMLQSREMTSGRSHVTLPPRRLTVATAIAPDTRPNRTLQPTPLRVAAEWRCTGIRDSGIRDQGFEDAAFASAWTACTIDIRPMPLPIEMFCRKICSTMSALTRGDFRGGQARQRLVEDRGERLARKCPTDSRPRSAASSCRPAASAPRRRRRTRTAGSGATCRRAASRSRAALP